MGTRTLFLETMLAFSCVRRVVICSSTPVMLLGDLNLDCPYNPTDVSGDLAEMSQRFAVMEAEAHAMNALTSIMNFTSNVFETAEPESIAVLFSLAVRLAKNYKLL